MMVRTLNSKEDNSCVGAILLTASHNPGGEKEDFGIKFNCTNGGPAPESITNKIFEESTKISTYRSALIQALDLTQVQSISIGKVQEGSDFSVDVVDSAEQYLTMLKELFDLD